MRSTLTTLKALTVLAMLSCVLVAGAHAAVEDCLPADATAVIKVTDLGAHYGQFAAGPLAAKLRDPSFLPDVAAGIQQAENSVKEFEQAQGVDAEDVVLRVLGREFALAAFPDETAVVVAEGDTAQSIRGAVEEFLRVEGATGELTGLDSADYKGTEIHIAALRTKTRYHALSGRVLAVSESRSAVQRVIDVIAGDAPALSSSEQYREATRAVPGNAVGCSYVGGALLEHCAEKVAQDAASEPRPARGKAGGRAFKAALAETLGAAEFATLALTGDDALRLHLSVSYKDGRLPPRLHALLPEPGAGLDILDTVPPEAAIAVARNVNLQGAWNVLVETMDSGGVRAEAALEGIVAMVGGVESREQFFDELGGQAALFVLPGARHGTPPAVALVARLRSTDHIPEAIESIVGAVVYFARASGKQDVSLTKAEHSGTTVSTVRVEKPGPWKNLSPSFFLLDNQLVLTTSADAAERIIEASSARRPRPEADLTDGTVFVRGFARAGQLRSMLAEHRDFLVQHAAEKNGKTRDTARHELEALGKLLSLVEDVRWAGSFSQGRTDHVLIIRAADAAQ